MCGGGGGGWPNGHNFGIFNTESIMNYVNSNSKARKGSAGWN